MWNRTTVNLGVVKVGSKHCIDYVYTGSITIPKNSKGAYTIITSCDCSGVSWNPDTQTMTINYTAKPIPQHLISKGIYTTNPHITFDCLINGEPQSGRLEFIVTVTDDKFSH